MFESFSSGYYVGRMYVEPHDCDQAMIQSEQHERVNEQLYATGEGVERLDNPLVMKLDRCHLAVHGDDSVPENTLAVPEPIVESGRYDRLPALREVLLAKADRAVELLEVATDFDMTSRTDPHSHEFGT